MQTTNEIVKSKYTSANYTELLIEMEIKNICPANDITTKQYRFSSLSRMQYDASQHRFNEYSTAVKASEFLYQIQDHHGQWSTRLPSWDVLIWMHLFSPWAVVKNRMLGARRATRYGFARDLNWILRRYLFHLLVIALQHFRAQIYGKQIASQSLLFISHWNNAAIAPIAVSSLGDTFGFIEKFYLPTAHMSLAVCQYVCVLSLTCRSVFVCDGFEQFKIEQAEPTSSCAALKRQTRNICL